MRHTNQTDTAYGSIVTTRSLRLGLLALLLMTAPFLAGSSVAGDQEKPLELVSCVEGEFEVVVQVVNESSFTRLASVEVVALVGGKYVENRTVSFQVAPYSDSTAAIDFSGVVDGVIMGIVEGESPF